MIAAVCGFLVGIGVVGLLAVTFGSEKADEALAEIGVPDDETPIPWQPVERLP